ncbi:calponin homology domain-containing protein DDB_G0272472 isoform X2 [Rosa chinensis]|uniref:calponin homology domain-containing protein DDB_G0272472 isoform X2 n=1 Tax=Rosa chinensis TaxID=74649 RepID=UPI000D088D76|nr:calponin homology domain-containing protein DDB_G0272472 isoform X2 [Rosa chinensis]
MTAEVDVHRDACESELSKVEDGNVSVNVSVIGNGNGISKDDGDGSYVFVTAASDESDLTNGHYSRVETNGGGGVQLEEEEVVESSVVVENPQSQLQSPSLEKAAAEESTLSGDPATALHLQSEEDKQLAEEVPVGDHVQESELTSQADTELHKQIVFDPESKENNLEGVPACDANDSASASTAEQNGSFENGRSVAAVSDENGDALPTHDVQESPSESLVANHLVDTAEKNNGSCVENGQILAANVDVQDSFSEPVAEEINGSCEQDGQNLAANGDVKECVSDSQILAANCDVKECVSDVQILAANDDVQESVSESITEKINVSCEENGQILAANVDVQESIAEQIDGLCEENGQVLDANVDVQESVSEPIAEKINESCEENGQILAANVDIQESILEHIAEKINGLCEENGQILADNFEVQKHLETQVVNGLVSDKSEDESLVVHAHEESVSEPIDTNLLTDTPGENGSCENGVVLAASFEVQKQLETPVVSGPISDDSGDNLENSSEPMVTDDLVDTPEENGSSEKASVCENVPVENCESFATVADSDTIVSVKNGDSLPKEDDSTRSIEDETPETDVEKLDEKNSEKPSSCPHEHSKPEVEAESAPITAETSSNSAANDTISEPNSKSDIEAEISSDTDDALSSGLAHDTVSASDAISEPNLKSEIESGHAAVVDDTLSSCLANDTIAEPISKSECESKISRAVDDTLSTFSADGAIQEFKTSHDSCDSEKPVSSDAVHVADAGLSNLEADCADNNGKPTLQINDLLENEVTVPASSGADEPSIIIDDRSESEVPNLDTECADNNGKPALQINDSIENEVTMLASSGVDESSIITDDRSESETPTVDSLEGQDNVVEVEKRPFYFLIRIPRNDDENLKEQIKHAQLQVEEKTKGRDAIRSKMQMQRATCKEHKLKFEAAISEERAVQEQLKSKRREMDSVQFMINKVKDALSVEEIANTIRHMEHTMAHETLPLKEEKQYIRDIKQLKQRRDQLSYSLSKQDEVQQSLDQKDHIEQRIKDLKKEMDQLKENLLKAQEVTQAAKKKYNVENDMLHELQYQFEAADATRQEAYVHLQSLRKQNYEKTKHFWRYRNDAKAANDLALSGDKEQLQHLCINQVETFMELWNTNEDFRKEYTKCNTRSTLRRLRTLDGRSLGPDEEPPVIPDIVRVTRHNMAAAVVSTPEPAKRVAIVESGEPNDISAVEIVEQNNDTAKNKKPVKVASSGISQATVSGRNEIEKEIVEDPKPTKEEEELARKEEELRKEEAAARLREQRRLEEKAKAKEAMERKKRIAEKAQARAAIKAQKEAEEKEKEREKRVRKKERKKASATKATNGINEGESAPEPTSETTTVTPVEPEATEKLVTITKRSQKAPQFTKQTKVKSIPLPLRNRSKRRMQPWMWVLVTVVAILGLFLLGNGGSFSFKSMLERFF